MSQKFQSEGSDIARGRLPGDLFDPHSGNITLPRRGVDTQCVNGKILSDGVAMRALATIAVSSPGLSGQWIDGSRSRKSEAGLFALRPGRLNS